MMMTDKEICSSYIKSDTKKSQIKILSELNDTTKDTIIKILTDNNCIEVKRRKR